MLEIQYPLAGGGWSTLEVDRLVADGLHFTTLDEEVNQWLFADVLDGLFVANAQLLQAGSAVNFPALHVEAFLEFEDNELLVVVPDNPGCFYTTDGGISLEASSGRVEICDNGGRLLEWLDDGWYDTGGKRIGRELRISVPAAMPAEEALRLRPYALTRPSSLATRP